MIHKVEHFFRLWRRRISRSEWAIRRLRLPTSEDTGHQPGLLLIQIDGLARAQMERALARGRLPFLKHLLVAQHYDLTNFYSGLPSSTPAVQAELHYGVCCAVPAFTFFNRAMHGIRSMFDPELVRAIEEPLRANNEGLLAGGSSWSNIYTGGAREEECHFCAAHLELGEMFTSKSVRSFLNILLPHIAAFGRLFALIVVEFFLALWDILHGIYLGESILKELKFLVPRVLVSIGLREFISIGAKIDLARGLPVIHVNFLGYDEQAHRRGPDSAFAHWSLKGIDGAIRQLYRAAMRSARRDYQVWIFSDHGQERVTPYEKIFPGGLAKAVADYLPPPEPTAPPLLQRTHDWSHLRRVRPPAPAPAKPAVEPGVQPEEERFSIAAWGPVGHLYLNQALSLEQKRVFARRLVDQAQVPGILYPTGPGNVEWVHDTGIDTLPGSGENLLPHPEPLRQEVLQDLIALCEQEFSGDLVLLGWRRKLPLISFAFENGAHAGIGLEETQPFALLPSKTLLPPTGKPFLRPADLRQAALHFLGRTEIKPLKTPRIAAKTRPLRVMTYNVHSCLGMDGKISPRRIAQVIERHHPDIVALQEIDLGKVRSHAQDQAQLIADALSMQVCFCPTVVRGTEQYGHALLSHLPLKVVRSCALSGGPAAKGREPRGALWVSVELEGTALQIINTHFGLGRLERQAQVADLLGPDWIGSLKPEQPLLLCGDFNMLPQSKPYRALTGRLRDCQLALDQFRPLNTFTTFRTFSRIDHIFISDHFAVESVVVPRNHLTRVASDHLPLIVDLRWK